HASGGKARSGRSRQGSTWLRTALTEAAHAAAQTRGTPIWPRTTPRSGAAVASRKPWGRSATTF
ncbi:transposase, partial [Frankia sp. KB5]|uniref:transposase n=2 Tax=unclassified Frankia TaxID=2632575 RepID=UPI0012FF8138